MHEQELFKLAAKSDASADLEQVPARPVRSSLFFLSAPSPFYPQKEQFNLLLVGILAAFWLFGRV